MKCINCGHEAIDRFCPNCGQRAIVNRITIKETWLDFWSKIYGFDGQFSRTLRDLTTRPGETARQFIAGNRVLYYGPVGYFFLMITLYLLFLSSIDLDLNELMKGSQKSIALPQSNPKLQEVVTSFVSENIKMFAFLSMPFQAAASKYFLFRKSGYNYLEHSVLPFYATGHLYWLAIFISIIYKFQGSQSPVIGMISLILSFAYFGYAYANFMTYQSKIKSFFKGIGVYIVAQLLFMVTLLVFAVIIIVSLRYLSPETYNKIKPSNTNSILHQK